MLPTLSTARFATLLAVVVTLFASGVVAGAAGASLILGATNDADSAQTTLRATTTNPTLRVVNLGSGRGLEVESTSGAPLRLIAPSGTAAIAVNTTKKIDNLNADRLDGLNSTAFVRSNVAISGHFNCPASAWLPDGSDEGWEVELYYIHSTDGQTQFYCPVQLPDGATIDAVNWWVLDSSPTGEVTCGMYKIEGFGAVLIASAPSTGAGSQPGQTLLEDLTIPSGEAVVDNALRQYALWCQINHNADTVAIGYGQVHYTTTGWFTP